MDVVVLRTPGTFRTTSRFYQVCGELAHKNLNDQTVEGMRHKELPIFSVQHHPEASPGPHDSAYLFTEFTQLMEKQHV